MTKTLPDVIMIHGAFCGAWAMADWARQFETAGYKVTLPNLRHHVAHGKPRDLKALGTTSVADYVADIRELTQAASKKPILVGHSMGGLVAQMLAAQNEASAIVLLAPSAPWGVLPSSWHEVASAFGVAMAGRYWERALFPTYEIAADHALDRFDEKTKHEIFSGFVPESGRAVFEIMHWPLDWRRTTFVAAHSISCPVFCAVGTGDYVNPADTVRRIAQRYRTDTTYKEYKGMSHWIVAEPGWNTVADDALEWLGEL